MAVPCVDVFNLVTYSKNNLWKIHVHILFCHQQSHYIDVVRSNNNKLKHKFLKNWADWRSQSSAPKDSRARDDTCTEMCC